MIHYICTFIYIGIGAAFFFGLYFLMFKKAGGISSFKDILNPEKLKQAFLGPGSIGATLTGGQGSSSAEIGKNNLPEIAEKLGLHYHELPKPNDKKVFFWDGKLISGPYKGVTVEMRFTNLQKQDWNGTSYSYERTITVKGAKEGNFRISPKKKNVGSEPTGNAAFDEKLVFEGDSSLLSSEQFEEIAKLGWMNLVLNNGELLFLDTYFENLQHSGGNLMPGAGALKMMGATHPVWETNMQNPNMTADRVIWFVDFLVSIAKKQGDKEAS